LQCISHPFAIQDATGTNYNTGLTHVQTDGAISTGSGAQGRTTGTLYWKIPLSAYGTYRYQCTAHAPMVGAITVKNFATI
jgi:plastocyanin